MQFSWFKLGYSYLLSAFLTGVNFTLCRFVGKSIYAVKMHIRYWKAHSSIGLFIHDKTARQLWGYCSLQKLFNYTSYSTFGLYEGGVPIWMD